MNRIRCRIADNGEIEQILINCLLRFFDGIYAEGYDLDAKLIQSVEIRICIGQLPIAIRSPVAPVDHDVSPVACERIWQYELFAADYVQLDARERVTRFQKLVHGFQSPFSQLTVYAPAVEMSQS